MKLTKEEENHIRARRKAKQNEKKRAKPVVARAAPNNDFGECICFGPDKNCRYCAPDLY